ncbi:hypothetical protein H5410_028791 [Solanum commersonii]|uniref:Uncharacterized protein n=1 Tax=Solanum commersonii TaxID=4109 RepID=A0A9J5Z2X3_SOLCO|nr:hypothetical protein H5410_028791 [Solanum commersonii]
MIHKGFISLIPTYLALKHSRFIDRLNQGLEDDSKATINKNEDIIIETGQDSSMQSEKQKQRNHTSDT